MTLSKSGVKILLVLLYVAAVWVRVGSNDSSYPYFKGVSATNYRHSVAVSRQGGVPERDTRFFWPEGYTPARIHPTGIEYLTGFAFRFASLVSDIPQKRFAGLFTVLVFSLCVFTFYGFTRTLWKCRAAGLLAAFLVAFLRPLIDLTNGSEYSHGPFALLLVSLHLCLFLAWRRKPSAVLASLASLVTLALLSVWENGAIYVALSGITFLLLPGVDHRSRKTFLTWHLAAFVFAAALLPHLRAQRLIVTWPAILVLVTTAYTYLRHLLPQRVPAPVYILAGAVPLLFLLKPLQAGGVETLSEVEYWFYRLRFIGGKPENPLLLPESIRFLWSHARSTPAPYEFFAFLFPLLFLLPPAVLSLRNLRRDPGMRLWPIIVPGALAVVLFWIDRGTLYATALILFPLLAVAAVGIGKDLLRRGIPVLIAGGLVAINGLLPFGKANAVYRVGEGIGLSPAAPDGFVRASLGNADLDLVRYVVSRTSVRDPFLVPPELSSLVVTFAGRKTVLVPGIPAKHLAGRTSEVMAMFYQGEESLYEFCEASGIRYVIYSIDLLLDTSPYSPLYAAGRRVVAEDALARQMHFAPERLRHFNLVYQNDTYRLFKVAGDGEPSFVTDHPPVYQHSILKDHGDTLESFYERVIDILATYHTAISAQVRGDEEEAIRRFHYCLDQAPKFSKAWMGAADSLIRLRRFRAANAAYMRVLENAPDDTRALYYAALTFGHMKEVERALGMLEVLFATGGDRELLRLGRALKITLEKGIPLDGSPKPSETP